MQSSIKLDVDVEHHSGILRGQGFHRAKCGQVEGEGKTEANAKRDLAARAQAVCADLTSPTILWDLLEPRTFWIAYPTAHGWMYSVERQSAPGERHSRCCGSTMRGSGTREECLDAMREAWYSQNVESVVLGICALVTGLRSWDCPRCGTPQRGRAAPYVCQNPRCGDLAPAFPW